MLFDTGGIDVFQMDFGETAYVCRIRFIPAAAAGFSVISISKHTERTILLFILRKISFFKNALHIVGKRLRHYEHLLPENQIQIHFLIQIREREILFFMLFNILRNDITNFRKLLCVQGMRFFDAIFIHKDKVDGISAVFRSAEKTVFPVFSFCENLKLFLNVDRGHIQFFCNFRCAHGLFSAEPYDMSGKHSGADAAGITPGGTALSPDNVIDVVKSQRSVTGFRHFFYLTFHFLSC